MRLSYSHIEGTSAHKQVKLTCYQVYEYHTSITANQVLNAYLVVEVCLLVYLETINLYQSKQRENRN